jgi:hypothetical protein
MGKRGRGRLVYNKLIMQVIELAQEERECTSAQLLQLVHSALLSLRFQRLPLLSPNADHRYDGAVWLARTQTWLEATWAVRTGSGGVRA